MAKGFLVRIVKGDYINTIGNYGSDENFAAFTEEAANKSIPIIASHRGINPKNIKVIPIEREVECVTDSPISYDRTRV